MHSWVAHLYPALIDAPCDPAEATFPPILAPHVCYDPVVPCLWISAPPDDFHSVGPEHHGIFGATIHSASVVEEVRVRVPAVAKTTNQSRHRSQQSGGSKGSRRA